MRLPTFLCMMILIICLPLLIGADPGCAATGEQVGQGIADTGQVVSEFVSTPQGSAANAASGGVVGLVALALTTIGGIVTTVNRHLLAKARAEAITTIIESPGNDASMDKITDPKVLTTVKKVLNE